MITDWFKDSSSYFCVLMDRNAPTHLTSMCASLYQAGLARHITYIEPARIAEL